MRPAGVTIGLTSFLVLVGIGAVFNAALAFGVAATIIASGIIDMA